MFWSGSTSKSPRACSTGSCRQRATAAPTLVMLPALSSTPVRTRASSTLPPWSPTHVAACAASAPPPFPPSTPSARRTPPPWVLPASRPVSGLSLGRPEARTTSSDPNLACAAASLYYDVCKREGLCTGGIVGTATAVKTLSAPTALTTLRTSMPTACSSMIDIYSSCYAEMDGFLTARAREVASCFWYVPPRLPRRHSPTSLTSCQPKSRWPVGHGL